MMSPVNSSRKPQEAAAVKCPRCDSPNTKFCYYNNYSLTQPRHFCKTCRRYWTKGGALRNVPIGGGCRKNKKAKSSDVGAFKFFQGISPAMDFQLGAINNTPRFSNTDDIFNHFSSLPAPCFNLESSSPVSFPLSSSQPGHNGFEEMGSMNIQSSIESLSSINQDLHWKLQQQRFASLLAEDNHKPSFVQKPQPILFQNLENSKTFLAAGSSRKDGGNGNGNLFFNSSYAPATSSSNNWSGINQAWTELTHFASLPN